MTESMIVKLSLEDVRTETGEDGGGDAVFAFLRRLARSEREAARP